MCWSVTRKPGHSETPQISEFNELGEEYTHSIQANTIALTTTTVSCSQARSSLELSQARIFLHIQSVRHKYYTNSPKTQPQSVQRQGKGKWQTVRHHTSLRVVRVFMYYNLYTWECMQHADSSKMFVQYQEEASYSGPKTTAYDAPSSCALILRQVRVGHWLPLLRLQRT